MTKLRCHSKCHLKWNSHDDEKTFEFARERRNILTYDKKGEDVLTSLLAYIIQRKIRKLSILGPQF